MAFADKKMELKGKSKKVKAKGMAKGYKAKPFSSVKKDKHNEPKAKKK